jgi:hypothetical protein
MWRYGISKNSIDGQTWFEIREFYYDDVSNQVDSWTENPVVPIAAESPEELVRELQMMLDDAKEYKPIDIDKGE